MGGTAARTEPRAQQQQQGKRGAAPPHESLWHRIVHFLPRLRDRMFKKKEDPKTPIKGFAPRIKNLLRNNFRGILGTLIPLIFLAGKAEYGHNARTVEIMWMMMFWFYLVQPVAIPVVGLVPIFLLPMTGSMSTVVTCSCYMNENVLLYILSGMLIVLLNNSGIDRRVCLWLICSGDACQFSGKRLVFKVSTATFFLSMFSSRLITTHIITQYMTNALTTLDTNIPKGEDEPDFIKMRNIINNAIQTSSAIGSTAILHSSFVTVLFRGIFAEAAGKGNEFPDIFNYLAYSAFAFPVAFVMFLLNVTYHMLLINWVVETPMTGVSMTELRRILKRFAAELPRKVSLHERLTVIFAIVYLCMFFFRWSDWIEGWAEFRRDAESTKIPRIKDATVGATFLIFLHILPKSYGFLKYLDAEKKSELPPIKPESAVLWWKFVDRNINYGYIFTFGSAFATMHAALNTGLAKYISAYSGRGFTEKPWNAGIFFVVFVTTFLANVMSSLPVCAIFLPFVMCMAIDAPLPWPSKVYCAALGVGIASNFGFSIPFKYTPAYFCHHTGKVPIKKMMKYSFVSLWICLMTLWIALLLWAPYLFDPKDEGIVAQPAPAGAGAAATTSAPSEAPPGL